MYADALAPSVARSSVTMVLIMPHKKSLVLHMEKLQLLVLSLC